MGVGLLLDSMDAAGAWGARWDACTSPLARRVMKVAARKQSAVCLAADRPTLDGLLELIDQTGPHVVALKTHVDLVEDWSAAGWKEVLAAAEKHDLLIFEDRKFADIGRVSRDQMSGIYNIASWADVVTSHLISGPDVVDGLQEAWAMIGRQGGVLLLAQMSSRANLLEPRYTAKVVQTGRDHPGVLGFIGNGSHPDSIADLRADVGAGRMIWTPGINLVTGSADLGQRYGHPTESMRAGADIVIVGGGIHRSADPVEAARAYARASWEGLLGQGS